MADDSLKDPVSITAINIMAQSLPPGFSPTYRQYVLSQSTDLTKVVNKANDAGNGAWDAQVKNDEQDVTLEEHENRLNAAEAELINHENRITAAEGRIEDHEARLTTAEEQIANHETRITANEAELDAHEGRISQSESDISALTVRMVTAENAITAIQTNATNLTTRVTTAEGNIATLQGKVAAIETNYLSKAVSTSQSVQASGGSLLVGNITTPTTDKLQVSGSANATTSYKVAGLQVVSARQTGWTASTGVANKGAFNADLAFTVSATYTQSEVQALADGLLAARRRIKALEDALRTHGLIA
ncbi:phage tail protein [Pluralibacter gergoviae]|uniref:phage tail protein n=1 Tax=Pluralibacter gergoviae TaxID=61647 RepID=UPI00290E8549|nr:phage tail protein [Pluralibacter gergoviae]MDU4001442.1 phage tail protein [Pluralibacter gergoviae]